MSKPMKVVCIVFSIIAVLFTFVAFHLNEYLNGALYIALAVDLLLSVFEKETFNVVINYTTIIIPFLFLAIGITQKDWLSMTMAICFFVLIISQIVKGIISNREICTRLLVEDMNTSMYKTIHAMEDSKETGKHIGMIWDKASKVTFLMLYTLDKDGKSKIERVLSYEYGIKNISESKIKEFCRCNSIMFLEVGEK